MGKLRTLGVAVLALLGCWGSASPARAAHWGVSIGIGVPGPGYYRPYYPYGYYRPYPVYVAPAPVYVQPAPVYVQPAPVAVQPVQVVAPPAVQPAPPVAITSPTPAPAPAPTVVTASTPVASNR